MSLFPQYTHIVNPKLKHIYLSFDNEGILIIKSPKMTQRSIEQLLLKKASWIRKSQKKLKQKKGKPLDFTQNTELYYGGKAYALKLVVHQRKRIKFLFDGKEFTLFYQNYDEKLFQKHIDQFYTKKAKQHIPSLIEKWSIYMGLSANKISFRKTKRQWGSCSAKNNLSFNTMMMKLPTDVIQYIIVHELAHIKYKHHQKTFWQLVNQYLPEYKTQVKELKNYMP